MELALHALHLLRSEARVREHANLRGDVGPVASAASRAQAFHQSSTHSLHAICHLLQVLQPADAHHGEQEERRAPLFF